MAALDLTTVCAISPVRGFGLLYTSQPAVAARLGCALAPEHAVDLVSQTFKDGRLLWRSDQKQVIVLFNTQHWWTTFNEPVVMPTATTATGTPVSRFAALLDAPSELSQRLGAATSSDQSMAGAVQDFKNGLLIWTADHTIFVLSTGWEQYADTFRDATPTPAATLAAAANSAASATALPLPSPPPTFTPLGGCSIQPVRGFGLVWQQNPTVVSKLGCALAGETGIGITRETFDNGLMLWPGNIGNILVFRHDGTWAGYPNSWQAGQPLADVGAPPAGHVAPTGGFGQLWRQQPSVRPALGWATAADQLAPGATENFAKGQMLWTNDHMIYVLFGDGTYQSFVDSFVG